MSIGIAPYNLMIPQAETAPAGLYLEALVPEHARVHECAWNPLESGFRFPGIELDESLRTVVWKRKQEYLAGRFCAAAALRGLGAQSETVLRGAHGLPIWPEGFAGSISHTDGFACAVAASSTDTAGMGIDVEQIVSEQRATRVAPAVASEDELASAASAGLDAAASVTMLFSAKESLYKCVFPHVLRYFGYSAARILEIDAGAGRFTAQLTETLSDAFPAGTLLDGRWAVRSAYVYTMMFLGPDVTARSRQAGSFDAV